MGVFWPLTREKWVHSRVVVAGFPTTRQAAQENGPCPKWHWPIFSRFWVDFELVLQNGGSGQMWNLEPPNWEPVPASPGWRWKIPLWPGSKICPRATPGWRCTRSPTFLSELAPWVTVAFLTKNRPCQSSPKTLIFNTQK